MSRRVQKQSRSTEEVVRGADELDFLESRAKSVPFTREVANATVTTFFHGEHTSDANAGAQAHDVGTELNRMYKGHVDAVLGFASWEAFLDAYWPDDPSTAQDRQRIARLLTRTEAARYGLSRAKYGLRLLVLLKLDTFEALERRALRLHPREGGGTVKFPASSRELRSAIRQILAAGAQQPAEEDERDDLRATYAILEQAKASDPEIAAIKPVAWVDKDGVHTRVTTTGTRGAAAAQRLYRQLERAWRKG